MGQQQAKDALEALHRLEATALVLRRLFLAGLGGADRGARWVKNYRARNDRAHERHSAAIDAVRQLVQQVVIVQWGGGWIRIAGAAEIDALLRTLGMPELDHALFPIRSTVMVPEELWAKCTDYVDSYTTTEMSSLVDFGARTIRVEVV